MPDLQQTFNYSVPASTPTTAPVVEDAITSGIYMVVRVSIVIPDGPAGMTGIQLWYGGNAVIPYASGWISGNDETYTVSLSSAYPPGVAWQVAMINSDPVNLHNFQVRWEMNFISATTQTTAAPVTTQAIYSAAG